jgi:hypothetical protein
MFQDVSVPAVKWSVQKHSQDNSMSSILLLYHTYSRQISGLCPASHISTRQATYM